MNGYAAVYEPVMEPSRSFEGVSGVERIGRVHATEADESSQPGPRTLCDLDARSMLPVPGNIPADPFDTWYPPGKHVRDVCRTCNKLAT